MLSTTDSSNRKTTPENPAQTEPGAHKHPEAGQAREMCEPPSRKTSYKMHRHEPTKEERAQLACLAHKHPMHRDSEPAQAMASKTH